MRWLVESVVLKELSRNQVGTGQESPFGLCMVSCGVCIIWMQVLFRFEIRDLGFTRITSFVIVRNCVHNSPSVQGYILESWLFVMLCVCVWQWVMWCVRVGCKFITDKVWVTHTQHTTQWKEVYIPPVFWSIEASWWRPSLFKSFYVFFHQILMFVGWLVRMGWWDSERTGESEMNGESEMMQ